MRRYVIAQNRRLRGIMTNQKRVLEGLSELHDPKNLFLFMLHRGSETFLPLSSARLNKCLLDSNKVLVFTSEDIDEGELDDYVATFSIQEVEPNVLIVEKENDE